MRFRAELSLSESQIERIFEEENGENEQIDDCLDEAVMNMEVQSSHVSSAGFISSKTSSMISSMAFSNAPSKTSSKASNTSITSKTSKISKTSKNSKNIDKHKCMWPRCKKVFDEPEDLRRHVYCHDLT